MDQTKKNIPEERYKLEIFVKGIDLMNLDTFSKSDPYCKLLMTIQGENEEVVGESEFLKNNLNPAWDKIFTIDYIFELTQKLVFQVWDKNQSAGSKDALIGQVQTTVSDIIGQKDMKTILVLKTEKGKDAGKLQVNIDKQPEDNQFITFHWAGVDLINTDGYFGKSDPFLKFFKKVGGDWLPVHKTEMIKDNLNPEWKPFQISIRRLCGGNLEEKFKVECWDVHEKGMNNQWMGQFVTSVHDIMNEQKASFNLELKAGKSGGTIILKDKKITKRPTFMDFLRDGEQINLIIAIDYTAQNGNQQFADSLHAFTTGTATNAYETAIKSCAQILINYDYDKKVAMYGFGCIPHLPNFNQSETEQCFPLTGDFKKPEVYGLEGIINTYKQTLPNLQFSGPAELSPIIEYVQQIAEFNKKKRIYTVLLILTCGEIHDLSKSQELLAKCATVPMSVVLVGIGETFDFSKLTFLDQDQKVQQGEGITRDVVQFVQFSHFKHSLPILQRQLMAEIPQQLQAYKHLLGLTPTNY